MNERIKTAKDLAFDRERCKLNAQIKKYKETISEKDCEITKINEHVMELETKCAELQDWVNRLLEYMDLPEEDFKKIIERNKKCSDILSILKNFPFRY